MSEDISQNNDLKRNSGRKIRSVAEALGAVMEPVVARKTGMTLDLVKAWSEIAGSEFSNVTRPQKIKWPQRAHEDDPFEPATLVVACEPSAALFFQHEQAPIVERVNLYFGFEAIKRIRIVQKPVLEPSRRSPPPSPKLSEEKEIELQASVDRIEDPKLRNTLEKLGRGIISSKKKR